MQEIQPKLLNVIALLDDHPEAGLKAGQMGTIVELLGQKTENGQEAYEVEFCDKDGRSTGFTSLRRHEFLVLLPMSEAVAV